MKLDLVRGDITEFPSDAIVAGSNTWLMPAGGGIEGAMQRAGGPTVLDACQKVIREKHPSGLNMGQAVATTAGNLPAAWMIHVVTPIYSKRVDRSEQLIRAYRSALMVADELRLTSISFPALSIGNGKSGYPVDVAARLAVEALVYAKTNVQIANFVLIDAATFDAFKKAMFED